MSRLKTLITLIVLLMGSTCYAQLTTVTATVLDSDGTAWVNGTWKVQFVPSQANSNPLAYSANGTPYANGVIRQEGELDASGNLVVVLYDTSLTTPIGSSWRLTICPNASSSCGIIQFTTAGSSMDISDTITAAINAPRFPAVAGSYGYTDLEAQITLPVGGTYWNVISACQRYYNGSSWACSTGTAGPQGPAGTPGTVLPPNVDVSIPSFAIPANTCYGSTGSTFPVTFTMTGVALTMAITAHFISNSSAIVGWGSSGGLNIETWASSTNQGSYLLCNPTSASITGGAIVLRMTAQ